MPEVERHPHQSIGGLWGVALFLSLPLRFQPQLYKPVYLAARPAAGNTSTSARQTTQRISSLFVATDRRSHQSKICKTKPFYFAGQRVYHAAND